MTLALYGKSRQRKGVLILLALFAIFAATIGGVAVKNLEIAQALDTGFKSPTSEGSPVGESDFIDPTNAYSQNASSATEFANSDDQSYGTFSLGVPSGATVTGIEVRVDAHALIAGDTTCQLNIRLWRDSDGGSGDWTARKNLTLSATESNAYQTMGGAADLWGEAGWVQADFTDANFAVEAQFTDPGSGCNSGDSGEGLALDHIQVRVHYTPAPTDREIRVQKVSSAPGHPGATFNFSVAHTGAGSPNPLSATLAANALNSANTAAITVPATGAVTVTETALAGWTDTRWKAVENNNGTATCGTSGFSAAVDTSAEVPVNTNDYLVCFRNTPPAVTDLTVTKVASPASVTLPNADFEWVITITNAGNQNIVFDDNEIILFDQLPVGPTYSETDNGGDSFDCDISGGALSCVSDGSFTFSPAEVVTVTVDVDPGNSPTTLTNPAVGGICKVDYVAAVAAGNIAESNEGNNTCSNTVTVNAASNSDLCAGGDVNACIALLHPFNFSQPNPANSCQGIDANFVIDRSGSIGDANMALVRNGITSFANALSGSSVFSGTSFSTTATMMTTGYVNAATFNAQVALLASSGLTWTEGGIQVGAANNTPGATANPDMMFVVTDGSPNQIDGTGNLGTGTLLNWIAAANDAIDAANAARGSYIVRAVFAGPGDSSIPTLDATERTQFVQAVMTRIGGGSYLSGDWDTIAANLLASAGCDATVNKSLASLGTPDATTGKISTATWTVTLTNPSAAPKVVTVTDTTAGALLTEVVGASACAPDADPDSLGPWSCTIPAKSGVNGQVTMTIRTAIPDYNVCTGTSGSNTVDVTGGATGTSTATYTIPANPNHPSCLGTIVVHKIEEGHFATAANTWNITLNGGTPQSITDGGTTTYSGLALATYTVAETNGSAQSVCSPNDPSGAFRTFNNDEEGGTYEFGPSRGNIVIDTPGQTKHVWFKNTPCPGTLSIAKSSTPQTDVPAGSAFTWTVTVTVGVNPTSASATIADTLPAPLVVAAGGVTSSPAITCPASVGAGSFNCTLASGTVPGVYTITIPVVAPANFPLANCKVYTNSATITGGGAGVTISGSPATDSVTVTNCVNPGLTLGKSDDLVTPLGSGGTFNWLVNVGVTNGPTVAAATITDTLPAGFTFNGTITTSSGLLTCAAPIGSAVTCTLASGAPGPSYSIVIPVKAPVLTTASQCGTHINNVTGTFPVGQGTDATPASDTVTITCPSLSITKAPVASPVNIGSNVEFNITVTNTSSVAATGISVNDQLPVANGISWIAIPTETPENVGGCSISPTGVLSCNNIELAAGGQVVIKVSATTSTGPGVFRDDICKAHFNSSGVNPATATVIGIIATQPADANVHVLCPTLSVAKAPVATPINAGAAAGFIITITNPSAIAASGVALSDNLPGPFGVTWTNPVANTGGGTCSITGAVGGQALNCSNLTVPANSSITVTVSGTTTKGTTAATSTCSNIVNGATVEQGGAQATYLGGISQQAADAIIIVRCPNPGVTKVADPAQVSAGDPLKYVVTITAGGSGPQDVQISDVLPGANTVSWSYTVAGAANTCAPASPFPGGSQFNCTFNALNPGNVVTITFTATSTTAMCTAQDLSNTAVISAGPNSTDVDSSNNSATATIDIICPSVTLTKVADAPTTVSAGAPIGFTITATNAGPGIAKDFVLTDTLPANVSNWTISPANLGCAIAANVLRCPPTGDIDLAVGVPLSVHVVGTTTAASCGTVNNTVTATASNQANIASAQASVTVLCPNVTVSKSASNGTISAGDVATFSITVNNTGLGTASNVTVNDTLPAGVTWSLVNPVAGCTVLPVTQPNQVLSCTFTTMAPAAPVTIQVTGVTPPAVCTALVNNVTVGASNESAADALLLNSASATISVNCADIDVLKTPDATPVNATDTVGFTITARNDGAGTAATVTINDTLPNNPGLAWTIDGANSDAGCSITAGQLTCNWGSLATNATKKVHLTSPTTIATCGPINNTAGVTTSNDGTASSSAQITVNCPNVSVLKAPVPNPSIVTAGAPITFQITVNVTGNGTAYNVMANDTLPANTSGWTISTNPLHPTTAAPACQLVVNVLTCGFGNVAAPASFVIVVTGNAIGANGGVTCGPLTNVVTVTAGNVASDADNTANAMVTVQCPIVAIEKAPLAGVINAGEKAEFTITVKNTGPGAATGVVVTDEFPNPTNLTWAIDPAVTGCAVVSDMLTCNFASLAGNSEQVIKVSATTSPLVCGVLPNYAYVTASNDNTLNPIQSNLAQITVNCPDIKVIKTGNGTINAGELASYTITVSNASAAGTGVAKGVTLTDTVPNNGITWSENSGDCTIAAGVLTCTFGDLDPNESHAVTLSGTTTAAQCAVIPNTASVSATNEAASALANNSSTGNVTVNCPDLEVTKLPDDDQVSDGDFINAGDFATFTIKVTNLGPGEAKGVELTDVLPSQATGWTITPPVTGCDLTTTPGSLFCDFGDLEDDEFRNVTIIGRTSGAACGPFVNTANATATNEGDDVQRLANNGDSGTVTVICPDVDVVKTGNGPIDPGEDAIFTITISNTGLGNAYNTNLTDQLPAGITWTSDREDACDITAGLLDCTFKEIVAADSVVITVTGATTPAQCGSIVNPLASITLDNEPVELEGDNTSGPVTIVVACGSIQIVKVDQLGPNSPQRPDGGWNFEVNQGVGGFEGDAVIVSSGSVTISDVPLGTGFTVDEIEAVFGTCPVPNEGGAYRTTVSPAGAQDLTEAGQTITFTFTNRECDIVLSTGLLVIEKVSDINGNHILDGADTMLSGWPMTITGPQFPGGAVINTDAQGRVLLPGILAGNYTVTEGARAGYQPVGVVADDNAPIFSVANTASVSLGFEDTDTITFYNQPRGSFSVKKTTILRHNGVDSIIADDDDGWRITVKSASCGIDTAATTDSNGNATFTNLPLCNDYVVAEDLGVSGAAGYSPQGPASLSNLTPGAGGAAQVNFTNVRITNTPPCPNCNSVPTPTPTNTVVPTATATPDSPTSTAVAPTNTPAPASSTPTPVSTTAGERTPGPGSPTPIAPSTGAGFGAGPVSGTNFLLVLIGLAAIAGGLFFVGAGRRKADNR